MHPPLPEASIWNLIRPSIAIVGAPPFARGTDIPGRDLELQLVEAFPRCALFVEKPVSSGPEDAAWRVADVLEKSGTLVGVGYMLRYLKGAPREATLVLRRTNRTATQLCK